MNQNRINFQNELAKQYAELFKTPEYAIAASRYTPEALAAKMTESLGNGTANKDGDGIKRTCKALGIKYTYGAIENFINDKG